MLAARPRWLIALLGMAVAFVTLARAEGTRAQGTPGYTVTLDEVLTTRSGVSSVVSVELHSLRPDGASLLQLGPQGETARRIHIPPGLLIETNDRDKRMSTFHVSPDRVTGDVRDPQHNCRRNGETFEGEEVVAGYRAARISRSSGGSMHWYALDHSCALVRSVMEHPGGSRSEKILVSLVAGPPPEALFNTDGYVEGPPSALESVASCDPSCEQRRKRRDAEYYRLRPR